MGSPGIGVMIRSLVGNKADVELLRSVIGKKIAEMTIAAKVLTVRFDDSKVVCFWDDGQSCCERRYMRSDDSPADHIGAELQGVALADASSTEDEYGSEHEIQFLELRTSAGVFVVSNHNEHNGYYGGFALRCTTPDEVLAKE